MLGLKYLALDDARMLRLPPRRLDLQAARHPLKGELPHVNPAP
jgi:hypothetical protein